MPAMRTLLLAATAALTLLVAPTVASADRLDLQPLGQVATGGAEIAAYHPASERAFVTDAGANALHIVDLSDPSAPALIRTVDLAPYGAGPNSVAVSPLFGGLVAVAVEAEPKTDPGSVVLFNRDGEQRGKVIRAGALPDMLTFSPDGRTLLVANEGEPNDLYTVDPEGSVTVIEFRRGLGNPRVRSAGFAGVPLVGPVRLFGFNAPTPAQDLEPEYLTTNGRTAWVTLQENNAVAVLDVDDARFEVVRGLGFKDHGAAGNGLDPSDRDNRGTATATCPGSTRVPTDVNLLCDRITPWPGVRGMYQPDAIASFRSGGETLLVTANEGDARSYPQSDLPGGPDEGDVFTDEARVGDLTGLGYTFGAPLAGNTGSAALGRLNVARPATIPGGPASGELTQVHSFGARSMSVWSAGGTLVADTGDELERLVFRGNGSWFPGDRATFNTTNDPAEATQLDNRSDNKGPEPEAVAVGRVHGTSYAFLGAERQGGIFAYDLSDPQRPAFSGYANTRPADLGPEGIAFVHRRDSPNGQPLLLVANELTGTLRVLGVSPVR
jgi:hypothetical protein